MGALPFNDVHLTAALLSKRWRAWALRQRGGSARFQLHQDQGLPAHALQHGWQTCLWSCQQRDAICVALAAAGQLDELRWLYSRVKAASRRSICRSSGPQSLKFSAKCASAAARNGHAAVLDWLCHQVDEPAPVEESLIDDAARGGSVEVLKWLQSESLLAWGWGVSTCAAAAEAGELAVLQWARSRRPPCPWDEGTCAAAARAGQLAVLQWARSQRLPCPWDEGTCAAAARAGQLEVLQWARSQQPPCPWDETVSKAAAGEGRLNILQWLRSQDPPCPWDDGVLLAARDSGRYRGGIMKWALDNGCPDPEGRYARYLN